MWFRGKELAMAMGTIICVSRLGSVATFASQGPVIDSAGVTAASFMGTGVVSCSWVACVACCLMDKKQEKQENAKKALEAEEAHREQQLEGEVASRMEQEIAAVQTPGDESEASGAAAVAGPQQSQTDGDATQKP